MAITIEDIEALRRRLAELPRNQPREVTKQEAVSLLASELGAARRRGYSPEDLAQLLSEQGVMINAATLRGYLRRKRKARKPSPINPTPATPPSAGATGAGASDRDLVPSAARGTAVGADDDATPKPRTEAVGVGSRATRPAER
jgi:hypothetical protein